MLMPTFIPDTIPPGPSFSFVGANATISGDESDTRCNLPSGCAAGDVALFFDVASAFSGTPSSTLSSGFTAVKNVSGSNTRAILSIKQLDATDISNGFIRGIAQGSNNLDVNKLVAVFRPSMALSSLTYSTWDGVITSEDPSAQNVSASGQTGAVIVLGCMDATLSAGDHVFSSFSPTYDQLLKARDLGGGVLAQSIGFKLYNPGSAAQDHSVDMGDVAESGVNVLFSGWVRGV